MMPDSRCLYPECTRDASDGALGLCRACWKQHVAPMFDKWRTPNLAGPVGSEGLCRASTSRKDQKRGTGDTGRGADWLEKASTRTERDREALPDRCTALDDRTLRRLLQYALGFRDPVGREGFITFPYERLLVLRGSLGYYAPADAAWIERQRFGRKVVCIVPPPIEGWGHSPCREFRVIPCAKWSTGKRPDILRPVYILPRVPARWIAEYCTTGRGKRLKVESPPAMVPTKAEPFLGRLNPLRLSRVRQITPPEAAIEVGYRLKFGPFVEPLRIDDVNRRRPSGLTRDDYERYREVSERRALLEKIGTSECEKRWAEQIDQDEHEDPHPPWWIEAMDRLCTCSGDDDCGEHDIDAATGLCYECSFRRIFSNLVDVPPSRLFKRTADIGCESGDTDQPERELSIRRSGERRSRRELTDEEIRRQWETQLRRYEAVLIRPVNKPLSVRVFYVPKTAPAQRLLSGERAVEVARAVATKDQERGGVLAEFERAILSPVHIHGRWVDGRAASWTKADIKRILKTPGDCFWKRWRAWEAGESWDLALEESRPRPTRRKDADLETLVATYGDWILRMERRWAIYSVAPGEDSQRWPIWWFRVNDCPRTEAGQWKHRDADGIDQRWETLPTLPTNKRLAEWVNLDAPGLDLEALRLRVVGEDPPPIAERPASDTHRERRAERVLKADRLRRRYAEAMRRRWLNRRPLVFPRVEARFARAESYYQQAYFSPPIRRLCAGCGVGLRHSTAPRCERCGSPTFNWRAIRSLGRWPYYGYSADQNAPAAVAAGGEGAGVPVDDFSRERAEYYSAAGDYGGPRD